MLSTKNVSFNKDSDKWDSGQSTTRGQLTAKGRGQSVPKVGVSRPHTKDSIKDNTKDTPAKAGFPLKKKMDIDYETGEPIPERPKAHVRDDVAKLARLFDRMAGEFSKKPIATPRSYFIVLNAMKPPHNLKMKGIVKLFQDWFNNEKIKPEDKVNLSFALSAGNINSFKVKN